MRDIHTALAAIVGLTLLGLFALFKGVDGTILSITIGAIAGLGGYTLGKATGPPGPRPGGTP